jgi:hypothetical protein
MENISSTGKSNEHSHLQSLPVELLTHEIGKNLDISGMIAMSFVCKDFQEIYQPQFQKIVKELDPYITEGTVYDFLRITRVGTIDNVTYKIWKCLFDSIIKEMESIYPTTRKRDIIKTFVSVIRLKDVTNIKNQIKSYLLSSDIFFTYKEVFYKNPYGLDVYCIPESFETEIIDMIDGLLHELSFIDRNIPRDNSLDSLGSNDSYSIQHSSTDESLTDSLEYFPYENVIETIENLLKIL